jgi:hypothetical protein
MHYYVDITQRAGSYQTLHLIGLEQVYNQILSDRY